jgi:hypothetical protein
MELAVTKNPKSLDYKKNFNATSGKWKPGNCMKREIIIEVERIRVIYNRRNRCLKWCAFCLRQVEILTLEEALEIAGINPETICHFIGQGRIHLYQTREDESQICLNSLLNIGNHLFWR